jgi:hypothetical protein
MADPSELEQSTPLKSQYISGKKRNNPDSPDSYSPSDKQLDPPFCLLLFVVPLFVRFM